LRRRNVGVQLTRAQHAEKCLRIRVDQQLRVDEIAEREIVHQPMQSMAS
jgi:hypothetical protein